MIDFANHTSRSLQLFGQASEDHMPMPPHDKDRNRQNVLRQIMHHHNRKFASRGYVSIIYGWRFCWWMMLTSTLPIAKSGYGLSGRIEEPGQYPESRCPWTRQPS